ncbi:hypothetical protein ACFVR1_09570 [Psychrobacillus sp. NPDC058041]|uniref:hypothetical protein n=1 Tax=Psychrobacillus sp. NPDC058041 TaxID=3346310 RepID=UPI0036DB0E40
MSNPYIELLEEQKSLNLHFMEYFSQLSDLCHTILGKVQEQEIALNAQKRTLRINYLNLRNVLIENAQTTKKHNFDLGKLSNSHKMIIEQLRKQREVLDIMHRRIVRQKNYLNNSSITQNRNIKYSLEKYDSLEKMNETILNHIKLQKEEQEDFFHKFLEVFNNPNDDLVNISVKPVNPFENLSHQPEDSIESTDN